MWDKELIKLIEECRAANQDQRFGQLLYNAIAIHDQTDGRTGEGYQEDFHSRLFYLRDEDLVLILKEWFDWIEEQRSKT